LLHKAKTSYILKRREYISIISPYQTSRTSSATALHAVPDDAVSSAIVAEVPATTRCEPKLDISFQIASFTTVAWLYEEGIPEIAVGSAALHCSPPLLQHRAHAAVTSSLKPVVLDPARRDDGHMRLDHHDALDPQGGPPEFVPKPAALQVSSSSVSIFNETPGVDLSVCSNSVTTTGTCLSKCMTQQFMASLVRNAPWSSTPTEYTLDTDHIFVAAAPWAITGVFPTVSAPTVFMEMSSSGLVAAIPHQQ
jgi:hypothetical protein